MECLERDMSLQFMCLRKCAFNGNCTERYTRSQARDLGTASGRYCHGVVYSCMLGYSHLHVHVRVSSASLAAIYTVWCHGISGGISQTSPPVDVKHHYPVQCRIRRKTESVV